MENEKQKQKPKDGEKKYDNMMSALISRNPQAFLDLLHPGSRFVAHHRNKLGNTQRQPDAVIEAVRIKTGRIFLAQPEIQTDPDSEIAERLALYQVLLRWDHKKRTKQWVQVSSSILHLTKAHEDMQIPLHWTQPSEEDEEDKALDFFFKSVEMRNKTPEDILHLGHLELLPLLPATQGGSDHQMIEMMMKRLQDSRDAELPYYGYLIAGLTFNFLGQRCEMEWLRGRFKAMDEKFRSSPVYQWTIDEGIAIGEERGIARGIAEGIAIGEERGIALGKSQALAQAQAAAQAVAQAVAQMRKKVMDIVIARFLSLVGLANGVVATINNSDLLLDLLVKLAQAQSMEDAEQALLNAQAVQES